MDLERGFKPVVARWLKKYAIILVLVMLVIILSLLNDKFLQLKNLSNVLRQIAVVTIMSFGVTNIIITGGIDLGMGSYVALSGVLAASVVKTDPNAVALALLVGLGIGSLCGIVNGAIIVSAKIPPFIVTLGMTQIARGAAMLITNGKPISMLGEGFTYWGKGDLFGFLPMPIVVMLFMFLLSTLLLTKTKFGKYARAIGGNETAARISGINTGWYKFLVYAYGGLCCGVAAMVMTARIDSGQPGMAEGYELDAIASSVIGGTSQSIGGVGTMWGALVGSLIIGSLNTGLNLLNVSSYWQLVVKGLIIIVAIVLDERKNRVKA
ncbi:MAG: ABC transporter permease [Christensenellales bacterium]|jgi:inositol transport system permease protein